MSPLSMESAVRLRLAGGFFLGSLAEPEGMGVLFSEFEEEEGREGWCVTGGRAFIAGGGAGAMGGRSEDEEGCIAGDIGVRAEGGRGEGASGHERARTFGNGGGEGRERDWTTHVGLAGKDAGDVQPTSDPPLLSSALPRPLACYLRSKAPVHVITAESVPVTSRVFRLPPVTPPLPSARPVCSACAAVGSRAAPCFDLLLLPSTRSSQLPHGQVNTSAATPLARIRPSQFAVACCLPAL